jgi:hypothetical protein
MLARCAAACALACVAPFASALESATWPPPPEVLGRMRDLQAAIADPATSKEARASARAELGNLLRSPAGQERKAEVKRAPRAAIDPFPSVVRTNPPRAVEPPVARLEVLPEPAAPSPKPAVDPATGSVIPPATGAAVDPATGRLLHAVPGGYIEPLGGRFIPR